MGERFKKVSDKLKVDKRQIRPLHKKMMEIWEDAENTDSEFKKEDLRKSWRYLSNKLKGLEALVDRDNYMIQQAERILAYEKHN